MLCWTEMKSDPEFKGRCSGLGQREGKEEWL